MADLYLLAPHSRMTPAECLSHAALDGAAFAEVMVIGVDAGGLPIMRSSSMSRKDALWLALMAIDIIRDTPPEGRHV